MSAPLTIRATLSTDWGWPAGPSLREQQMWQMHIHAMFVGLSPPGADVEVRLSPGVQDSVRVSGLRRHLLSPAWLETQVREEWERWVRTL